MTPKRCTRVSSAVGPGRFRQTPYAIPNGTVAVPAPRADALSVAELSTPS